MSSMKFVFKLEMCDIENYAGGGMEKRCFREGAAVYNSNHYVTCGINLNESNAVSLKIFAVCLQSSSPRNAPHEIKMFFQRQDMRTFKVTSCSCLAGLGTHCKHVFAVLFYIHS